MKPKAKKEANVAQLLFSHTNSSLKVPDRWQSQKFVFCLNEIYKFWPWSREPTAGGRRINDARPLKKMIHVLLPVSYTLITAVFFTNNKHLYQNNNHAHWQYSTTAYLQEYRRVQEFRDFLLTPLLAQQKKKIKEKHQTDNKSKHFHNVVELMLFLALNPGQPDLRRDWSVFL